LDAVFIVFMSGKWFLETY